jgi:predicted nucleic acid-binding protein
VKLFVLDASVALAWFIDRPTDPYAQHIRERLRSDWTAVSPLLWQTEVANILVVSERRKLLSTAEVAAACSFLRRLSPTKIRLDASVFTLDELTGAAREFGLTSYDAAYLLLALRENLPIATLDKALQTAAAKAGVPLMK